MEAATWASAQRDAREIDGQANVTVVVADAFPNYSTCGLPSYLSGETPEWQMLAHRTKEELEATGMTLLLNHTARNIDPTAHTVALTDATGKARGRGLSSWFGMIFSPVHHQTRKRE